MHASLKALETATFLSTERPFKITAADCVGMVRSSVLAAQNAAARSQQQNQGQSKDRKSFV